MLSNNTYTNTIIKTFKISTNIWYKIVEANVSGIILSHLPLNCEFNALTIILVNYKNIWATGNINTKPDTNKQKDGR